MPSLDSCAVHLHVKLIRNAHRPEAARAVSAAALLLSSRQSLPIRLAHQAEQEHRTHSNGPLISLGQAPSIIPTRHSAWYGIAVDQFRTRYAPRFRQDVRSHL